VLSSSCDSCELRRAVWARVDRARGARARSPSAWLGTPERWIERKAANNRQAILFTRGFQLTDQISGSEPEKGNILSKMGSVSFSMFDSRRA
jgi:hypothetical protein